MSREIDQDEVLERLWEIYVMRCDDGGESHAVKGFTEWLEANYE